MKIQIKKPQGFSEIGGRGNNEDCIFPSENEANENDNIIIVCDGVGGASKGEVASALTVKTISEFLRQHPTAVVDKKLINAAVRAAQEAISRYVAAHEDATGMATTLTLFYAHENGVTLAHAGDSRIYHIRGGKILYRSKDHSYLNELIEKGIISEEEAKNSRNNRITRAVVALEVRAIEADVYLCTPEPNDYFFMCTDGVLENLTEEYLLEVLQEETDNREKIEKIRALGLNHPQYDNFSAYLIQIDSCEENEAIIDIEKEIAEVETPENSSSDERLEMQKEEAPQPKENGTSLDEQGKKAKAKTAALTSGKLTFNTNTLILLVAICFGLGVIAFVYFFGNTDRGTDLPETPEMPKTEMNSREKKQGDLQKASKADIQKEVPDSFTQADTAQPKTDSVSAEQKPNSEKNRTSIDQKTPK